MIPEPVRVMWDADLASRSLGMELVDGRLPGTAVVRMPVTDAMINGHDVAHGGYLFLLADSAFACACNSHGPVTLAAGADITFVAPVKLGDRARGARQRAGPLRAQRGLRRHGPPRRGDRRGVPRAEPHDNERTMKAGDQAPDFGCGRDRYPPKADRPAGRRALPLPRRTVRRPRRAATSAPGRRSSSELRRPRGTRGHPSSSSPLVRADARSAAALRPSHRPHRHRDRDGLEVIKTSCA